MAENPYNDGRITTAGTQKIDALHPQKSGGSVQKQTGTDLRAGKK